MCSTGLCDLKHIFSEAFIFPICEMERILRAASEWLIVGSLESNMTIKKRVLDLSFFPGLRRQLGVRKTTFLRHSVRLEGRLKNK